MIVLHVHVHVLLHVFYYRRQYEIELCLDQQNQQNQLGAQHQQKYHHLLSLLNNQH